MCIITLLYQPEKKVIDMKEIDDVAYSSTVGKISKTVDSRVQFHYTLLHPEAGIDCCYGGPYETRNELEEYRQKQIAEPPKAFRKPKTLGPRDQGWTWHDITKSQRFYLDMETTYLGEGDRYRMWGAMGHVKHGESDGLHKQ